MSYSTVDPDITSEEERLHFFKIVSSFKSYRVFNNTVFLKRLKYLDTLPDCEQRLLANYRKRLERALLCIEHNHSIIRMIIRDVEMMFENVEHKPPSGKSVKRLTSEDLDKVNITLRQIYRDWSSEGSVERDKCYRPILLELEQRFPPHLSDRSNTRILVPGAGLGRLAFEIAKRGFTCEGNEFSFFMLMAANFILNKCPGQNVCELYPWVHHLDNIQHSEDQFKKISFPDCDPSEINDSLQGSTRFSMAAGDFTEVYLRENDWDCVASCFFIDCAANIHRYILQIFRILKPGGTWINFGPLQYHFSTSLDENSIEPSYNEVLDIITDVGFIIQKEETGISTTYSQNQASMMKHVYDCAFLVCIKPLSDPTTECERHLPLVNTPVIMATLTGITAIFTAMLPSKLPINTFPEILPSIMEHLTGS